MSEINWNCMYIIKKKRNKKPLPSIEYIYSKLTHFPEGQQFTKNYFFYGSYEVF